MSHHYLRFTAVSYRYPDGHLALDGVTFEISHGEKVALLGRNGAGKSTLLLHVNGLLSPESGEVNVGGLPVTRSTVGDVRRSVGMVFQNPDDQLFMPTVAEDVAFGPANMRLPADEIARRVAGALAMVDALDLARRSPMRLSGGQKRRVAIATVLSMQPDMLVLDEPTAELDRPSRRELIDLLNGFGHTCLIATHDIDLALSLCPRALLIDAGKIVADGATRHVISSNRRLFF
jgi:cobalt/nickel transport system ATP-binding protein